MKKIFNLQTYIFLISFIMLSLTRAISFAQDSAAGASSSQTTTTTSEHTTTVQPWVWVVGGIVLLLIIIALVRGKKSDGPTHTDKVTVTKTTSSEDNA
jgi:glucan phosphoethanolaminetransferase (alkaline phosphatase superfamily)